MRVYSIKIIFPENKTHTTIVIYKEQLKNNEFSEWLIFTKSMSQEDAEEYATTLNTLATEYNTEEK